MIGMIADGALALKIRAALRLDPHMDGTRIRVYAREGVVGLEGSVRFEAQALLAEAIAVRAGARMVGTHLEVREALAEPAGRNIPANAPCVTATAGASPIAVVQPTANAAARRSRRAAPLARARA